ncbi:DUF551 domain-containing protein [Citrobacter werkmanii]|uniref:DUF551 domain-containing protein n=2 Tax=Citrobacter TaxID=544 RepID=UPI00101CB41A|nr:DUF551 domain-containing protein [Citrobacter werkmanii]RYH95934.1 DUF551 domain-containing protein [Citrobacter werkmanii]
MKTNNHPANGPVSLDRLHQIRQYIERNNQYQNGGNRAYILADMLKVIDGAIAAFGADPVAWQLEYRDKRHVTNDQRRAKIVAEDGEVLVQPLYTAPPAPVVPDELTREEYRRRFMMEDNFDDTYRGGWNACRYAMLQAGNHTEQHLDMVDHSVDVNEKVDCRLPFDQWLSQQNEPIDVDCGCVTTEAFYHWLRVAYEAGNSPVTSCGWVMVPKVPTEAMCETGHIGVDVYTGLATEGDGYYSIGGEDAARVWEFMIEMAPKQENTMDYITKLSPKLVSVGMFEQLSFHDGFSLKCRELGIHASKLGHIELSKKAQDLMFSASLQQHDQLVDNMASLIELMADNYMRNTANSPVTPDAWIPVSERMPEIRKNWLDMPVIIAVRGEKDAAEAMYCSDGKFRWGRDEQPIEYVTHWMPLPAAPQQEDKNV